MEGINVQQIFKETLNYVTTKSMMEEALDIKLSPSPILRLKKRNAEYDLSFGCKVFGFGKAGFV